MNAKLTLTLEKTLIDQAKKYARSVGKSPSAMIGDFIETLMDKGNEQPAAEAPIVSSLRGAFAEPAGFKPKKRGRKPAEKTSK